MVVRAVEEVVVVVVVVKAAAAAAAAAAVVVVVAAVVDSAAEEERPACFPFCRMRESAGMKSLSPERRTAQSYLCDGRQCATGGNSFAVARLARQCRS